MYHYVFVTPVSMDILHISNNNNYIIDDGRIYNNTLYLKGPLSPKRLCALVLLFWPASFVECSVLIGCYFPSGNFQLREIHAMHSG